MTFDWRLSLAQVDRDGPFSRFDNVDRTLVLLSGAMTLHEHDRRIDLVRNEPFAFAGERAIEATVGGGSTARFQCDDPSWTRESHCSARVVQQAS